MDGDGCVAAAQSERGNNETVSDKGRVDLAKQMREIERLRAEMEDLRSTVHTLQARLEVREPATD